MAKCHKHGPGRTNVDELLSFGLFSILESHLNENTKQKKKDEKKNEIVHECTIR